MASHYPNAFHEKDIKYIENPRFQTRLKHIIRLVLSETKDINEMKDHTRIAEQVVEALENTVANAQQPPPKPTTAFLLFRNAQINSDYASKYETHGTSFNERMKYVWDSVLSPSVKQSYEADYQRRVENYNEYMLFEQAYALFVESLNNASNDLIRVKWDAMPYHEQMKFVEQVKAKKRKQENIVIIDDWDS